MERLIKSLQDKHDTFIGNRKDQITSAKAEGFKSGLLWAIETAKSIIEQDLLDDEWNEQLLEELRNLQNMLLFEKLESLGYEKKGNWYIQKNISVNLFTKEVKSSNRNVMFNYVFEKEVDVDKCELIRSFISSFETHS